MGFPIQTFMPSDAPLNDREPEAQMASDPSMSGDGEPADIDLSTLTAIVVEDEEAISQVLCALLGKIGFRRAIAVGNAEDAIYQLEDDETTKIDIALVDLMLPGASGLALIKTMREHKTRRLREMPVVVITSYTSMKVYRKAAEFDINGFLRKPVAPGSLQTAVIKALGGKVSAKAMQAYRAEASALQKQAGEDKKPGFFAMLFGTGEKTSAPPKAAQKPKPTSSVKGKKSTKPPPTINRSA